MAKQKEDDQHEHTFSSYETIRDVALKTCQRRWIIGRSGEWGSGISVLAARHDDDDDDDDDSIKHYLFICTQLNVSKLSNLKPIIQFKQTVKNFQVLQFKTNNYVQHLSFVFTQLKGSEYPMCYDQFYLTVVCLHTDYGQRVPFLKFQFNISHFFAQNLNVKQFVFYL